MEKLATPRERSWPDYDPKAPGSPWGPVQVMYDHPSLRGVRWVSTAGHGGMGVADGIARKVLSPAAYKLGERSGGYVWYEEDVAATIPFFEHPEWYQLLFGKILSDSMMAANERSIRQYYPRYFKMKEEGTALLPRLSIGDTLTVVQDIKLSRGAPLRAGTPVQVVKLTAGYVYVVAGSTGYQVKLPISYYESGSDLGVGEGKVFLAKMAAVDLISVQKDLLIRAMNAHRTWQRAMHGGAPTHLQEKAEQELSDALGPVFEALRAR